MGTSYNKPWLRLNLIYPVLWAVLIFILSILPNDDLPKVGFQFSDKIAHLGVYGVLSFLLFGALRQSQQMSISKSFWITFLICSFFGVMIEFVQEYFGRYLELMDMLANVTGCLCGILVYRIFFK